MTGKVELATGLGLWIDKCGFRQTKADQTDPDQASFVLFGQTRMPA